MKRGGRAAEALRTTAELAALAPEALRTLAAAGVLAPTQPARLARAAAAMRTFGPTPAAGCAASAARWPNQPAIVDERGSVTYAELDARAGALAAALEAEFGVGPQRPLAVMCRNHRGFVEAMLAGARLGADVILLNTDFPGPQLGEVLEREGAGAAVLDHEFADAFDTAGFQGPRAIAWHDAAPGAPTLDDLAGGAGRDVRAVAPTAGEGKVVILTSGTTGTPKGAPRRLSRAAMLVTLTSMLGTLPLRTREPVFVAPPIFHALGFGFLGIGLFLGSTVVLQRRFEPDRVLAAVASERAPALVAVPVMLQRMLELPAEDRDRHDLSALRAVIVSGSAVSGELAHAFMDAFGEVLFNLYGSTENGWVTMATPADLRAAPGTAGRAARGTRLRLLDEHGDEVPQGETGRIFVASRLLFEGYTGGGSRERVGAHMTTGDLGRLDAEGRLFVQGRDDDMVISGGENVFPQEVEEVLATHEAVADVAVTGVADERFGQRLKAFVVVRAGQGAPSADDLKQHVRERLARYKVPRDVEFVDEIPRTPTGKVLHRRLRESDEAGRRRATSRANAR